VTAFHHPRLRSTVYGTGCLLLLAACSALCWPRWLCGFCCTDTPKSRAGAATMDPSQMDPAQMQKMQEVRRRPFAPTQEGPKAAGSGEGGVGGRRHQCYWFHLVHSPADLDALPPPGSCKGMFSNSSRRCRLGNLSRTSRTPASSYASRGSQAPRWRVVSGSAW
jgi:hypothetical protein